jgi:hypothetical protein
MHNHRVSSQDPGCRIAAGNCPGFIRAGPQYKVLRFFPGPGFFLDLSRDDLKFKAKILQQGFPPR